MKDYRICLIPVLTGDDFEPIKQARWHFNNASVDFVNGQVGIWVSIPAATMDEAVNESLRQAEPLGLRIKGIFVETS